MRYSKERLFSSCNVKGHCVAAHLLTPIFVNEVPVDTVYILKLELSDSEIMAMRNNIANSINTMDGTIKVIGFIDGGNPCEPIRLTFTLEDVFEIESIELH